MDSSRLALVLLLLMLLSVLLVSRVMLSARTGADVDAGTAAGASAGADAGSEERGAFGPLGGLMDSAVRLIQPAPAPHAADGGRSSNGDFPALSATRKPRQHSVASGAVHREADRRREHDQDAALHQLHHDEWRSPQPGSQGVGLGGLSADTAEAEAGAATGKAVAAAADAGQALDYALAAAAVASQGAILAELDGGGEGGGVTSTMELRHLHRQLQRQGITQAQLAASAASPPPSLHCANQSVCLTPELQLTVDMKIYFCAHVVKRGVRFYYLVREGLLLHPRVTLVPSPEQADYLVYLPASGPWHKTECNGTRFRDRLVVLDEFDLRPLFVPPQETRDEVAREISGAGSKGVAPAKAKDSGGKDKDKSKSKAASKPKAKAAPKPKPKPKAKEQHRRALAATASSSRAPSLPPDYWYFAYFKRSFVTRHNGLFDSFPHAARRSSVYPLVYSLAEAYIPPAFTLHAQRSIEIVCTLRGHKRMQTRLRVQQAVQGYVDSRNVTAAVTAQVDKKSRTVVSTGYFQQMRSAYIVVTVNPSEWEGDFRLMEALATGALVFVDRLFVPHPHPLLNHVHCVYYDNSNMTELAELLDYYRSPEGRMQGRAIAARGYQYALKYHRTVSMMDYILRTVHVKAAASASTTPAPAYRYTGQFLNARAAALTAGKGGGTVGRLQTPASHRYLPGL